MDSPPPRDPNATADHSLGPVPGTGGPGQMVSVDALQRGAGVAIPRRGAEGIEGALAAANDRARAASLDRLARWFPGYDFAAAAQNVDDRRYTLLEVNQALLDHLDAPAAIDCLVTHKDHLFGATGVTFSRPGMAGHQSAPAGTARFDPNRPGNGYFVVGGLADAIGQQWTTILNGFDRFDPRVASVCDDLTRAYGARVNTNVYLSQGKAEGFGPHWDTHDTIIVQVLGTKAWSVFEPLALSSQRPWIDPVVSDRPVASGVLEPGMALVIPRGWGHQVHDSDELTIHYTIGIDRLETHQLLDRVGWEAGFWPMLRADVPYDPTERVESYGGSVYDRPGGFGEVLGEVTTDDLIQRAIASYRARTPNRLFPELIDTFRVLHDADWSDRAIHLPVPSGVGISHRPDDPPDVLVTAFNGLRVQVRVEAADALAVLAAGEPKDPLDLPTIVVPEIDGVDPRVRFAGELVRLGLAQVVRTDGPGSVY